GRDQRLLPGAPERARQGGRRSPGDARHPASGAAPGLTHPRFEEWEPMSRRLEGKVALITGAARGQGEAEARLVAAEGARVVLGDGRNELGEKVAASLGGAARYVQLDVAREDQWQRAVALAESAFGRLDVLVNNAGIVGDFCPTEHYTLESYQRT